MANVNGVTLDQRLVLLGSSADCTVCGKRLFKGMKALKTSRKAETYRERCNANQYGHVVFYRCEGCKGK